MNTFDRFIDAVSTAMSDHDIEWFYDFDAQDTQACIEDAELYPDPTHRLLPIEPLSSREAFRHMKDFAITIKNPVPHNILWTALSRRHPFSAFQDALRSTNLREAWFEFKRKKMQIVVEDWMEENEITYEDGIFKCEHAQTYDYFKD
jgi:hypothetical protein